MSGVTWRHRNEGDWLASNGRWYPSSKYPRGWSRTALPPAPDHGSPRSLTDLVSSAAIRMQELAGLPNDDSASGPSSPSFGDNDSDPADKTTQQRMWTRPPTPVRTPYTRPPVAGRPPSQTNVAQATVTSQKTHTSRVGPGAPPAKGLPPAPGRVSPDGPDMDPTAPPPPTGQKPADSDSSAVVRPPMPAVGAERSPNEGKSDFTVVAGDLGRVFGSARRRIEKATEKPE